MGISEWIVVAPQFLVGIHQWHGRHCINFLFNGCLISAGMKFNKSLKDSPVPHVVESLTSKAANSKSN